MEENVCTLLSITTIGILKAEMKYLLSVATLITKEKSIVPLMGLSNEALCILVCLGAAQLQEVKVEGSKKMSYK